MRILVDTNVILDVVLQRPALKQESALVWERCEGGGAEGLVSSVSCTTIGYFVQRSFGAPRVAGDLEAILKVFAVAAVSADEIEVAMDDLKSGRFTDFEDAVQHAAAEGAGAEAIITRNTRDFAGARLNVLTPAEYLTRH